MAKLAFCGLGQMGLPIATRLLAAGHDLVVWNRTPTRARALVDSGARVESTPAAASRSADVVFTMLSTPDVVRDVVLGDEGVASGMVAGATLVEMSTIGRRMVLYLADALPPGISLVDAPVLGSVPQATEGALKIFVGGAPDAFERHRDVLEALGSAIHVGPLGAGAAMKVVVNSALVSLMTCLGEALALADGYRLEEAAVLEILAGSPLGPTVARKRDNIAARRFPPNFKLGLASKDARLVVEEARAAGADLRLASAARSWLDEAQGAGLGDLDYSAVVAFQRGQDAHGS